MILRTCRDEVREIDKDNEYWTEGKDACKRYIQIFSLYFLLICSAISHLGRYLVTVIQLSNKDILWNILPMLSKYSSFGSDSVCRPRITELIAGTALLPGVWLWFWLFCGKIINWKPLIKRRKEEKDKEKKKKKRKEKENKHSYTELHTYGKRSRLKAWLA